jgi:hypothetical protein
MRFFLWAALVSLIGGPVQAAQCAPQTLVHIVFRDVTPGIDPASFQAQPKTLYRLGDGKSRSEEADDPPRHLHQLFVVAEPDIWMVNLDDGTGAHIVDPGPTYISHDPAVAGEGVSSRLTELEFGCEAEFIKDNGLRPARVEQIGGQPYDVYRLDADGDAIEILVNRGKPAYIRYFRAGQLVLVWRYDVYESGLKNDPSLFSPPAGVQYKEQKVNGP